ncbi:5-aminolevulic acid synthase [Nereida sp. MMG025]|uniref:5-aminolevulic acid synthase n=1 Tax=Nereida sp. MMG025 TaxID=2909981 RepID=UPI001F2BE442|nr:5-aminolevulic acid synthase [Nereida sp. MMG025]MCF6443657.1 5-aminolevulic acid synthase [Nereida sp. MMG025]
MRIVSGLLAGVLAVSQAYADAPFGNEDAKDALFALKGRSVEIFKQDFLTQRDVALLEQVAESQLYYAAIAASPEDGILNKATIAAANHHSIEVAEQEALSACNEARDGTQECVVVAHIKPRGWVPRDLQLSHDATAAWRSQYRRVRGEKAFAVSPSTGRFSAAKGDGAAALAVSSCEALAEAQDCTVLLQD